MGVFLLLFEKNGSVPLERRYILKKLCVLESGGGKKRSSAIYFKLIVVSKSTVETWGDTLLFALRLSGDFFFFFLNQNHTLSIKDDNLRQKENSRYIVKRGIMKMVYLQ